MIIKLYSEDVPVEHFPRLEHSMSSIEGLLLLAETPSIPMGIPIYTI